VIGDISFDPSGEDIWEGDLERPPIFSLALAENDPPLFTAALQAGAENTCGRRQAERPLCNQEADCPRPEANGRVAPFAVVEPPARIG
jgi:hypothetical protein